MESQLMTANLDHSPPRCRTPPFASTRRLASAASRSAVARTLRASERLRVREALGGSVYLDRRAAVLWFVVCGVFCF